MTTDQIIDKYVEAHADCRWMDAGDLRDLLNSFTKDINATNNLTWEDIWQIIYDYLSVARLPEYQNIDDREPKLLCEEVLRRFNALKETK